MVMERSARLRPTAQGYIGAVLMPLAFDRVYSHHFERVMHSGAKLQSSVERYAAAIGGTYDWA